MSPDVPRPPLGGRMVLILALACGVSVANVYFPQAISPLVASGLHVSPDSAALVATAAQVGYAVGIFLLVPLGDRLPHRPLIVTLLSLTGLGLLAASAAPALPFLVAASAVVGVTTVVPQVIMPMAAGLVADDRRGAVVGTLLGGLLGGILLARTFSGTLGEWLGWRAPYVVAAALALLLAVVLAFAVPTTNPPSRQRYPSLLAESLRLLRTEPDLRRSCFYQATLFAGFTAAWTSIALLVSGPVYGLGAQAVGLIALVGAGSVFCTPAAGRYIDRRGPDPVNLACILGAIAAAGVLLAGGLGGAIGPAALVVGMLLLDIAVQCGGAANQARIFALRPEVRSRLNTAYMTCSFAGGSVGSWLGVRAYTTLGWAGVCGLLALVAVLALGRHLVRRAPRPHPAVAEQAGEDTGAIR
ncbi:MFS transporter [Sphaerisporangium sp. NPDC088356]|uniref:MFS transporter n=1 Tax=Sphaerisporangium sp. NPDC088356 TaxID=3154871 RepID=UPI00342C8E33